MIEYTKIFFDFCMIEYTDILKFKKKSWKDIPWCDDSDKVDFQSHFS